MPKNPPLLVINQPKTGTHTHTCTKALHAVTCPFSIKCHLEMKPSAQQIIDEMCYLCHNLQYGNYGS